MPGSRHLHIESVLRAVRANHGDSAETVAVTSAQLGTRREPSDLDKLLSLVHMLHVSVGRKGRRADLPARIDLALPLRQIWRGGIR